MEWDAQKRLIDLSNEQIREFPIGSSVRNRFIPGSEGIVIEVQKTDLLFSPVFRVRWEKYPLLAPGITEDSDWINYRELRSLNRANICVDEDTHVGTIVKEGRP